MTTFPVQSCFLISPLVLDCVTRTQTDVELIKSNLDRKEELEVLEWLTPIDYGPQHSDILKRRQSGTAQWFLDSAIYQAWISSNKQTLFCPGIPGAGKTILTAAVIDDITARFLHDRSIGIAYVYCDFRRRNEQSAEDLITSLLKQLSQCRPSLPDIVRSLYDRHRHRRTRPEFDEISTTLRSVGAMYSRVFIIINALDECQASDDCRMRFIKEILNFQATCGGNTFATSRFIPQITERFNNCMTLEIRAHDQDVQEYLRSRILQCESRLLASHSEEIQTEITKAVDGMFLLAQLHFDAVKSKKTTKRVKEALKGLAKGSEAYNDAYEDVMQRIEGQDKDSRKLAHDALSWINSATRPLNTLELQHALAVEAESEFDRDNIPFLDDIISVCAGLVTVDEESDVIRLVHYTAQEFFQRTWTMWFSNAHHGIATACVTYLSFDPFKAGPCSTDMDFEARLDTYPLFSYAARNWGHHVRTQQTGIGLILALLEDTPRLNACVQGLFARKEFPTHWNYSQEVPKLFTGLHLASYFGLENVVLYMIQQGKQSEAIDSFGRLPLTWAAFNGYVGVAQHLLERSIKSDSGDNDGRTPLAWAACNGHERVVKLLAEKGLDLGSRDTFGRTPL
ncbi:ankyrin repeat domain-containing protein, partial [Aspergillus vadensis CBS 113365]